MTRPRFERRRKSISIVNTIPLTCQQGSPCSVPQGRGPEVPNTKRINDGNPVALMDVMEDEFAQQGGFFPNPSSQ